MKRVIARAEAGDRPAPAPVEPAHNYDGVVELVAVRTADIRKGPELELPRADEVTTVAGPAVVELSGSTCWIPPGWVGARDGRMLRLAKQ